MRPAARLPWRACAAWGSSSRRVLAFAAPAHAATLSVAPRLFSPAPGEPRGRGEAERAAPGGCEPRQPERPAPRVDRAAVHSGRRWRSAGTDASAASPSPTAATSSSSSIDRRCSRPRRSASTRTRRSSSRCASTTAPAGSAATPPSLTTVSPNGDGFRDKADVDVPATRSGDRDDGRDAHREGPARRLHAHGAARAAGIAHDDVGARATTNPRTYLIRLTAADLAGNRVTYGAPNAFVGRHRRASSCGSRASTPRSASRATRRRRWRGSRSRRTSRTLTYRVFHAGPEQVVTYADNQFAGVDIGADPSTLDWSNWQSRVAHDLSSGSPMCRAASTTSQFGGADDRVGYAPFVVRPRTLGRRTACSVVLPTNTWQAYNFQDDERRRLRRHLVRGAAEPHGRPVARLHRPRRAAALLRATTCRSCTGSLVGQGGRVHLRHRLRPDRQPATSSRALRPRRLRRDTRST